SLVQSLRSAQSLARHDSPPRGGRFGLLPPFLYGSAAGRRHAQTGFPAFLRVRTKYGIVPVVSFRGSSARRRGTDHERSGRHLSPHWPELGRPFSAERTRLVRPADARARTLPSHRNLLLHPRAPRHQSPPHQSASAGRGVCRVLRGNDPALRTMTTFLLIRHGAHLLGGDTIAGRMPEVRLSPLGHEQARRMAERVAKLPVQAIYSSPSDRTR